MGLRLLAEDSHAEVPRMVSEIKGIVFGAEQDLVSIITPLP